jgi:hypothetical protein|tara:strand:- start:192 stop:887 length:696 start_codon:yes stop_codon:yes gene_type:complete
MANFGWAYIDCDDTADTIGATCPTGSVLFSTGTRGATGSINFMYYTASVYSYAPNTVVLSGNLIVTGALTASAYHIESITTIDATGSTYFGNSNDDEHIRTGSLVVCKTSVDAYTNYALSSSAVDGRTSVRAFSGRYAKITATSAVIGVENYIVAASASATQTLYLPTASAAGAGALLVIKDQYQTRADTFVVISASSNAHQTVDAEAYYQLTGTMAAINLYSDGSNWFVF